MSADIWLMVLVILACLLCPQLWASLGLRRGTLASLGGLLAVAAAWFLFDRSHSPASRAVHDLSRVSYVTSESCFKCHDGHYATWHRSYHRTMTREATPENVKGNFANVSYHVLGVTSRMMREGDAFYMETADPVWVERMLRTRKRPEEWGSPVLKKFRVDRLVGSHWFQESLHRDEAGRYIRLPLSYHIVEQRWIHTNGAFLSPDTDDFWHKSTIWNESCVYCHNTKTSKNPLVGFQEDRRPYGYQTRVAELGIACEACHGPGEEHVNVNLNPFRRLAVRNQGEGDPTIVNPRRLSVQRATEICAHCHGALVPRPEAWDRRTHTDPYTAGDDLTRAYHFFWSEAEQKMLSKRGRRPEDKPLSPGPLDGRFWGDGTPLTTALEYQGMALSACYENGRGKLSCLSCHSMHDSDPNFQVARQMDTNEACFQCHHDYRTRVVEHTHHPASSAGSLCYNCHMPHSVYSLLNTHRSHRIEVPRIKDSLGTGKPHACNLCHLDKSLAWTQEWLGEWYGHSAELLKEEDERYASSIVHLMQSDARSRAILAGAFSWPAAQQASGTDWAPDLLLTVMEKDRYPAVRYLAHRALRKLAGDHANGYDYLAAAPERAKQLQELRKTMENCPRPTAARYPHLPLGPNGRLDQAAIDALLRKRNDPDVVIHE